MYIQTLGRHQLYSISSATVLITLLSGSHRLNLGFLIAKKRLFRCLVWCTERKSMYLDEAQIKLEMASIDKVIHYGEIRCHNRFLNEQMRMNEIYLRKNSSLIMYQLWFYSHMNILAKRALCKNTKYSKRQRSRHQKNK